MKTKNRGLALLRSGKLELRHSRLEHIYRFAALGIYIQQVPLSNSMGEKGEFEIIRPWLERCVLNLARTGLTRVCGVCEMQETMWYRNKTVVDLVHHTQPAVGAALLQ